MRLMNVTSGINAPMHRDVEPPLGFAVVSNWQPGVRCATPGCGVKPRCGFNLGHVCAVGITMRQTAVSIAHPLLILDSYVPRERVLSLLTPYLTDSDCQRLYAAGVKLHSPSSRSARWVTCEPSQPTPTNPNWGSTNNAANGHGCRRD